MAVKGTYNVDEFEDYLNAVEEGKADPKLFNRKIFKAAMIALVQLEIMIFFAASRLVELENPAFGFFTHSLEFDWDLWWSAQILEIVPIINAGFNATTNFKMKRMRNAMIAENLKVIKAKDTQISALQTQIDSQNYIINEQKKRLDDQAVLYEALGKATTEAEFLIIQKMLEREVAVASNIAIEEKVSLETPPVEEKIEEEHNVDPGA